MGCQLIPCVLEVTGSATASWSIPSPASGGSGVAANLDSPLVRAAQISVRHLQESEPRNTSLSQTDGSGRMNHRETT